jgi:hypothetical protein
VQLAAGGKVQVLAGALDAIGPPRWIAGTVHCGWTRLREGETLTVEDGGWLELRALADTRLVCSEPPTVWDAVWRAVRRLAAWRPPILRPAGKGQRA